MRGEIGEDGDAAPRGDEMRGGQREVAVKARLGGVDEDGASPRAHGQGSIKRPAVCLTDYVYLDRSSIYVGL